MSLALIDFEAYRKTVAGFVNPVDETLTEENRGRIKKLATDLVVLLARHYNRKSLKAVKIWDRIESAIQSSLARAGDDVDAFVSGCLEMVQAKGAFVASDPSFILLVQDGDLAKTGFRREFWVFLRKKLYLALALGKGEWKAIQSRVKAASGFDPDEDVEDEAEADKREYALMTFLLKGAVQQ